MDSSLQELANMIARETERLSTSDLLWHPEGKWSVADIVEHLSLTYTGTKIIFERCLQSGRPAATTPSAKHRLRTFVVIRLGYMVEGRKAPAGTVPKGAPPDKVLGSIAHHLSAMDESIGACEKRFGNVKLVNHPILGPLTAAEWRRFHCVHGRHHVRQIQRLRGLLEHGRKDRERHD